jgi:putative spermidine/putrescine transport system substrate-binding protein
MRRFFKIAAGIVVALVVAAGIFIWWQRPNPILTVTTWAGEYGRAQQSALFQPYGDRADVDVRPSLYAGGLEELRQSIRTKNYRGDVIDFELPDAISACKEGLLEKLVPPADANDFVPGAIGPCWIGSVIYSRIIGYDPDKVAPKAAKDFFDLVNFPGKRGLRKNSGKYNLEMALLADGVKPEEVYPLLATEVGISRALKNYQTIKSEIVWWSNSSEPLRMLEDGRVVMTTMLNEDLFKAATHNQKVGAVWDRQLYEMEAFGIARGTPKLEMAKAFLTFATSAEGMAGVAAWYPYGPARRSAWDKVGQNPELKIDMRPFSPTADGHFDTAFAVDDAWWKEHGALAESRWQTFVNQ